MRAPTISKVSGSKGRGPSWAQSIVICESVCLSAFRVLLVNVLGCCFVYARPTKAKELNFRFSVRFVSFKVTIVGVEEGSVKG